jgi:hypothetical protein
MRAANQVQIIGALGIALLSVPIGQWGWNRITRLAPKRPGLLASSLALPGAPFPSLGSSSADALREARWEWVRAQQAVARELEARLKNEPNGMVRRATDAYRQRLAALDPGRALQRARIAARRAAALARTQDEACRATSLLARIECDAGHHREELRYARRLVALAPRRPASWDVLKHAAICIGLAKLAGRADGALKQLSAAPMPAFPG